MVGTAVRRLRAELLERCGVHARDRARLDGSCAALLMYHRVLPAERARALAVEPGMFVTPESFARQLDWLRESFAVLPLAEVAERLEARRPLPPRACAITFDDGWRDNLEFALPALEGRGLPATVFLVTERVGTDGAFWPDELCQRLAGLPVARRRELAARLGAASGDPRQGLIARFKGLSEPERNEALGALREATADVPVPRERVLLDWDEVGRMAAAGVDFESHGSSHALLPGLDDAALERELRDSRAALLERGHGRHGLVAYPNGDCDARVRSRAREQGYRTGVTTRRGLARAGGDPMDLPRLGLHEDISSSRALFHRVVPGSGLTAARRAPRRQRDRRGELSRERA